MPLNRRSQLITRGIARSPNRAMLRAVGFGDGDFDKPIVGVANGHSTMNPCNAGIQPLVDRAMAALKEAGAMPQVFGGPIALVKEGDPITIDSVQRLIQLNVPAKELAARRRKWKQPRPRYTRGALAKFAAHVSSASICAVTD